MQHVYFTPRTTLMKNKLFRANEARRTEEAYGRGPDIYDVTTHVMTDLQPRVFASAIPDRIVDSPHEKPPCAVPDE